MLGGDTQHSRAVRGDGHQRARSLHGQRHRLHLITAVELPVKVVTSWRQSRSASSTNSPNRATCSPAGESTAGLGACSHHGQRRRTVEHLAPRPVRLHGGVAVPQHIEPAPFRVPPAPTQGIQPQVLVPVTQKRSPAMPAPRMISRRARFTRTLRLNCQQWARERGLLGEDSACLTT